MIVKCNCWKCNKEIEVEKNHDPFYTWNSPIPHEPKNKYKREYCAKCLADVDSENIEMREKYLYYKAKMMIERAITIMEHQNIDVYKYKEAIEAVEEKFLHDTNKFKSSEEIIAAIIFIQNRIKIKVNYPLGKYTADIVVPSLKCIVEIDGYFHNNEEVYAKDGRRDIELRSALGEEWETIRIPTKFLEKNAEKIVDAVKEMKVEIQKIRKRNQGILPEWFAKRYKAYYKTAQNL